MVGAPYTDITTTNVVWREGGARDFSTSSCPSMATYATGTVLELAGLGLLSPFLAHFTLIKARALWQNRCVVFLVVNLEAGMKRTNNR